MQLYPAAHAHHVRACRFARGFMPGLVAILLLTAGVAGRAATHDIRDFGAVPGGTTLNTVAINRAVAAAGEAGGGTVVVPAGRFLTGTIYLKSHVTLELQAGAVLLGATDLREYPENAAPLLDDSIPSRRVGHVYPHNLEFGRYSLIYASGQSHIAVVGKGTINGQGSHPNLLKQALRERGVPDREAYLKRPYGLCFVDCTDVRVTGINFVDISFWCQDYLNCDGVVVDGVTVDSRKNDANNDGIDIDGSRGVRITNCRFNAGDDAICLKASLRDCEDIEITNSHCSSLSNGLKFGTASNGGFRNIRVSGLTMKDVNTAGLALEVVDGGTMDGVEISDITMENVGAAIFVRLGDRGARWMRPEDHAVGQLRNITISRIRATIFTPYDGRPLASSVTGLPGHPVENVTLRDITITNVRPHGAAEAAAIRLADIGEHAGDYPEYSMFGALPGHGLFVRHARGVRLENFRVDCREPDFRSAIVCDRVEDLVLTGLETTVVPGACPVVRLHEVTNATLAHGRAPAGTGVFLRAEGRSFGVVVRNYDLSGASVGVSLEEGLPANAVLMAN